MLLNQFRCEDGDPKNLLRNSFYQFQADSAIPVLEKEVEAIEAERDSIIIEGESKVKDYYKVLEQYKFYKKTVRDVVFSPKYCLPFLQPGRLVCIECTRSVEISSSFSIEDEVTWGVILKFERVQSVSDDDTLRKAEDGNYTLDVLTRCKVKKDGKTKSSTIIIPLKEMGEPAVVSIPISQIHSLSAVRLVIPKDMLALDVRENTLKKVKEVLSRFNDAVPPLDPQEDMKVKNHSYEKAAKRIEYIESLLQKHEVAKSPLVDQKLKDWQKKQELKAKIKSIREKIKEAPTKLAFENELKARERVLRKLGYITTDGVVELKGKVACEVSSADELTLTELMFSGVFKDIKVEEMVSLLSCFVWQEKLQDAQKPREELALLFAQLQDTARKVAEVQHEKKVQIDVEKFVSSFRPDIMEAVYSWARGSKFYEIMEMTQVFEGSLIRAIRRLEEVLQQLIEAAKSIGEVELQSKFEEAVSKIKRDIVFAASLYL